MIETRVITKYVVDGVEFDTKEEARLYELSPLMKNVKPTDLQCFTSRGELLEWRVLDDLWEKVDFVIIKTEEALRLLKAIIDESGWCFPDGVGIWRYTTEGEKWIEYWEEMAMWEPIKEFLK